jgi:hypothetical protein
MEDTYYYKMLPICKCNLTLIVVLEICSLQCYDDNCCFVSIYNAIYYFLRTLHNFSVSDTLIFSLEANCELLAYNYKCIHGI